MRLIKAFLGSMVLALIQAVPFFFPFDRNLYNKTCKSFGEKGIYTMEKNCDQAKLLSRVGRKDKIKYAGVDLKVDEYVVCCVPRVIMVSTTIGSRMSNREEQCHAYCKIDHDFDEHIIHGESAKPGEFTHMAAIGYFNDETNKTDFNCGGALLSEKFVLTAAHCTNKKTDTPYKVRLGRVSCKYS